MNLTDVVPPLDLQSEPRKGPESTARETKRILDNVTSLRGTYSIQPDESAALSKMFDRISGNLRKQRAEILVVDAELPPDLVKMNNANDLLSKASGSPKASLQSLRDVAEKIGFPIFPDEYLDDRSITHESYELQQAVREFRGLKEWFDIYVIGPISHYSVRKHVEAPEDKPLFAPTALSQALLALSLSIPMFRTLFADMKGMKQDMRNLQNDMDARHKRTEQELQNLAGRVSMLEAEVARAKREEAIRRAEEAARKKREEELARIRALEEARWTREEPLMFAVPKGTDVRTGKGFAILGPCWGPDFDDLVFTALGIKKIDGQRMKHELAMHATWQPAPPKVTRFERYSDGVSYREEHYDDDQAFQKGKPTKRVVAVSNNDDFVLGKHSQDFYHVNNQNIVVKKW